MLKYKEFIGEAIGSDDARIVALNKLNDWLEDHIKIIGVQWKTYFISNGNRRTSVVKIGIMCRG